MTNALTLAATTHNSGVPAPLTIVLVIVAIAYVLWSRMQGRPLKVRRLVVLPAVLVVLGIVGLTGSSAPHLTPKDIAFLLVSVVLSIALGAARGATIELYPQQGELWQRYRGSTVGLWIALIGTKVVLLAIASGAHASAGGGTNSLLLSLGVSLLAEAAVVGPRALSTGIPFATNHQGRQAHATAQRPSPAMRSVAPANDQPSRDDRAQWSPPPQAFDYRQSGRSGRRHSHNGPIHRLLGATTTRRRTTGGPSNGPPAP
jgi:hypothetical protein